MAIENLNDNRIFQKAHLEILAHTVSALLKPRGSIFQNGFLGEVLFKYGPPGVVFKLGFYLLRTLRNAEALPIVEKH